jgi:hypothetical protein
MGYIVSFRLYLGYIVRLYLEEERKRRKEKKLHKK